jgi:hypothetical protein
MQNSVSPLRPSRLLCNCSSPRPKITMRKQRRQRNPNCQRSTAQKRWQTKKSQHLPRFLHHVLPRIPHLRNPRHERCPLWVRRTKTCHSPGPARPYMEWAPAQLQVYDKHIRTTTACILDVCMCAFVIHTLICASNCMLVSMHMLRCTPQMVAALKTTVSRKALNPPPAYDVDSLLMGVDVPTSRYYVQLLMMWH